MNAVELITEQPKSLTEGAIRKSRDAVGTPVKSVLEDAGTEIPYPCRTFTFHKPLPVRQIAAND